MMQARHFSEQNIAEFRDCFSLFARSGQIRTVDELTVIMRSLRTSPTTTEIRGYLKAKNGVLSFADFLECMHTQQQKEKSGKEIRAAFAASDPRRKGTIAIKELRHILSGWGEKLTTKEVDKILREANVKSNSGVVYRRFIRRVQQPAACSIDLDCSKGEQLLNPASRLFLQEVEFEVDFAER
nr:EOG090X0GKM [Sida crystallina]